MKSLLKKSNLIQLIAVILSVIFAVGAVTYSWYMQDTSTEDLLQLQADGAQVIMFESDVSTAALTGTLYPAKAKKSAYIDGTIPDVPQVIPVRGVLPEYIERAAGVLSFYTNLTYYAEGISDKIRLEILSSTKFKDEPLSRDLQSTGEINTSYQFSFQDFSLSIDETGSWNVANAVFPSDATIYKRENKKYFDKSASYIPLTGDTIVYNNRDVVSEYGEFNNEFITNEGDEVYLHDYQIAYIRNSKKYVQTYASYEPASSDEVIYINKIDEECVDNKIEDVLLTSDLVFYTRSSKNYIEKLSVYNSGNGATDDKAMKTGDVINYISVSSATSPVKPVYIGPVTADYVEYRIGLSSSVRYVVSSAYWETIEGTEDYHKVVRTGDVTNGYLSGGITFDDDSIVFRRKYSGTEYTCVDHINSYVLQTGDKILSYKHINSAKVTTSGSNYFANLVDIRNSVAIDATDRDVIYIDANDFVRWVCVEDVIFSAFLPANLLFANIVKKAESKVLFKTYSYYDPNDEVNFTSEQCLVLDSVSFNDSHTLAKRFVMLTYSLANYDDQEVSTGLYYVDKDVSFRPRTNDEIYYNIYSASEILYNAETENSSVNDLYLQSEDLVFIREAMKYVAKNSDYVAEVDDILLFDEGSAIGQELLTYDNYGYSVNRIGLLDNDTVYLRKGKVYVCTTTYYSTQAGDVSLYSNGVRTTEGEDYIKAAGEGDLVDYYVDNVSLLVNDIVYCRDNKYRFVYKNAENYVPDSLDVMIFNKGYMVVDPQTRFLIKTSIYITTLDQETSRDLIGATIVTLLSIDSPDII